MFSSLLQADVLHDAREMLASGLLLLVVVLAVWLWRATRCGRALRSAADAIARGDYATARVWADRAVGLAGKDLDLALALDELGAVYRFSGDEREAESCYRRALHLRQQSLPADHPDVGVSLHNVALSLLAAGRYAEAEPLYRRALSILLQAHGEAHAGVALSMGGLGQVCMFLAKFDESAELLARSLAITEQVCGDDHPQTAEALMLYAAIVMVRGRFHESDFTYRRCRNVREDQLGPDHPATLIVAQQHANLLNGWSRLTGDAAALAEAEQLAEEVVGRARAGLGPDHQLTGAGLRTLAVVRTLQGRPADAVGLAREALRIMVEVLGPDHVRSGVKRLTLARALGEVGELAEAEEHVRRAEAAYGRKFGPDHPEMGSVHEMLGRLAALHGRLSEAEEHLRHCLNLLGMLGPTHPCRAFALRELVPVLRQTGRDSEAVQVEAEIEGILADARLERRASSRREANGASQFRASPTDYCDGSANVDDRYVS